MCLGSPVMGCCASSDEPSSSDYLLRETSRNEPLSYTGTVQVTRRALASYTCFHA